MNSNTDNKLKAVSFRDSGEVYLECVKRPTFMYDKTTGTRIKYGEYEHVESELKKHYDAYMSFGQKDMANDLAIVEVPLDQDLIDNLFQSSGYFANFVKSLASHDNTVN